MIKVNILTGFFGSGKTTLISNIIKNQNLKNKVAIIQNEFSDEMGIEKDTLLDSEGNDLGNLIEMPNGCLCCVIKDNLVVFIESLIQQRPDIDIVLIESHGYTDVSNLIKKFWLDKELESPVFLNSIICLIDVFNYEKNKLDNEEVFCNQIISSDKIVLNKIDLITETVKLDSIKADILKINPLANVLTTKYSNIPIEYFLKESANPSLTFENNLDNFAKAEKNCSGCCSENKETVLSKINCHHLNLIDNLIVQTNIENLNTLDKMIGKILWDISDEMNFKIIRFKGIIKIKNEKENENPKFYSLQGLYDLYELNEIKINENNALHINDKKGLFQSKILFIGKNIKNNKKILEETLIL